MENRVNYLSDKLVHLRGELKSVEEVMTPAAERLEASQPAETPADVRRAQALDRRVQETEQLYNDLLQRLTRRRAQLEALQNDLVARCERAGVLSGKLEERLKKLPNLQPDTENLNIPSAIGEAYRAIDAERLDYFTLDAECERLLQENGGAVAAETEKAPEENFGRRFRNGWALALSLGAVIAAAIILAALILFAAWR